MGAKRTCLRQILEEKRGGRGEGRLGMGVKGKKLVSRDDFVL